MSWPLLAHDPRKRGLIVAPPADAGVCPRYPSREPVSGSCREERCRDPDRSSKNRRIGALVTTSERSEPSTSTTLRAMLRAPP